MLSNLSARENRKTLILSSVLGIYLSAVLSFNYVQPQSDAVGFLVQTLDKLQQWFGGYGFVWTLVAVLLAGFAYTTVRHIRAVKEPVSILLAAISVLFGVLNVWGLMMFYLDDLPFFESFSWMVITLFLAFGWAVLFYLVAHWILCGFARIREGGTVESDGKSGWLKTLFDCRTWLFSFVVIMLCWLPWILIYYPASMDFDVYHQLSCALSRGKYVPSNHHPWLASWVLSIFYKLGVKLGSENVGIFLFVFLRDLLVAGIFADCVRQLKKAGIRRGICVVVMLFFAVTPVWGAYAKHAFKDFFSAAIFCAYMTSLVTLVIRGRKHQLRWIDCVSYCVITVITALFRNNPIYAILPATGLLIIYLLFRKNDWKKCVALLLGVVLYFGINQYAFSYGGIEEGSSREAMSVLFQQTARTVKYHGSEITEEERQAIDAFLDYDSMAQVYNPLLSDPIKSRYKGYSNGEDAPVNYLKTWASMLLKYPDTYIEATIGNSYGYYSFTPKLPEGSGNWNSGMTIFDWIDVPWFADYGYDFSYADGTESARNALHTWAQVWESIPVLSLTNVIAAYTWLIILIGYDLIRRKKWSHLIPILAMGIMFLTCVASPVNDCFRYYCPVAASVPVLLLLLADASEQESEEVQSKLPSE